MAKKPDDKMIAELWKLQRGRCAGVCGGRRLARVGFECDHIRPRYLGGVDGSRNRQLLCPKCNNMKGAWHPNDFYRGGGFLL